MQEAAGSEEKNTLNVYLSPEAVRAGAKASSSENYDSQKPLGGRIGRSLRKGVESRGKKSLADSMVLSGGTTWAAVDGSAF